MNIQNWFSKFKKTPPEHATIKFGEDGDFSHPEDNQLSNDSASAEFDHENQLDFEHLETESLDSAHLSMADKVQDEAVEAGVPKNSDIRQKSKNKMPQYIGILLLIVLLVIGIWAFAHRAWFSTSTAKAKPDEAIIDNTPKNFNRDKLELEKQQEQQKQAIAASAAVVEQKMPSVVTSPTTTKSNQISPSQRKLTGNVLISDAASDKLDQSNSQYKQGIINVSANQTDDSKLGKSLQPTVMAATNAHLRSNLNYLLRKGTNIPCTLDTQIITTHAGLTRCSITKDVYSANGKVLLLERGSVLNGEQTAALVQGQARVFVLWTSAETPNGVSVNINSPSAGQLGASGNEANVDYHFWQRFGGAILISLIKDVGDSVSSHKGGADNNSVSFQSSTSSAEDLATEVLKNTINIPPTGYVNQGSLLNVMVARDVDFSGVYELVNINN